MNLFVHQNIVIHTLKIDGISNSSVFQIGSAGVIKSLSQFFNTGGFTEPAPAVGPQPFMIPLIVSTAAPTR
ncbi:MAG TPA: spore germination protein GerPB [Paenibacillus sp.]|uniref:spore germination protein GerPB n=1 Tax=Paenibacillus sp. TaxID=58172 RepID=UPI0028D1856F|nr:spore germination protein GerPB [Paenibacillus sp.]HUC92227.1 spore germination protein GerPB [Paenibacillus sp.]